MEPATFMSTVKKVADTTTKVISLGRAEKNLQKELERMQLAIAKGDIGLDKLAAAGQKELDAVNKIRTELGKRNIASVADYTELRKFQKAYLSGVTYENLEAVYKMKALEKQAKFMGKTTEKQNEVINNYFGLVAAKSWFVIKSINDILALEAPVKATAKAEAPAEVEA